MSKSELPRKALGKGLHSLLPARPPAVHIISPAEATESSPPKEGSVQMIPIELLRPNTSQPRQLFDDESIAGLAQSILRDGILQPLIARRLGPQHYQIIAGERRYRAARIASLKELPVIVRDVEEDRVLELALVENIQREDLDPIDLAHAFNRMVNELGLSHQDIGERTGKDRVTISNSLRLLQLAPDVQRLVQAKKLSAGHARALLRFDDEALQRELADRCIAEGWSVRQIEEYARSNSSAKPKSKKAKELPPEDPNVKAAIADMEGALGTRVRIVETGKDKGRIEIEFYNDDDLNRIYDLILRR